MSFVKRLRLKSAQHRQPYTNVTFFPNAVGNENFITVPAFPLSTPTLCHIIQCFAKNLNAALVGALGPLPSGNKPAPLEPIGNLSQLSIDSLYPLHVSPGPSSVLRVRCSDPRFAFGCPWSGGLAAVQPTPGLSFEGRLLARGASACFSEAAFARPIATETRCPADFDQRFVVN